MDDQNLIPSFQVDHNKLSPGVYVSRVDNVGGNHYVTTFDVRWFRPNKRFMTPASMHSIEHLMATYLRNREDTKDKLIGFFPEGCLTGCYIVWKGQPSAREFSTIVIDALHYVVNYNQKVPGTKKINCGNYKMHDLEQAKVDCWDFLRCHKRWGYSYPMAKRPTVKGVGAFHDS